MAGAGRRPWWQLACSAGLQMCRIQELLHPCSFHLGFKDKPGKPGHIVPQHCATWGPNGTTPSEVMGVKVVGDSRVVQQKQQKAVSQEKPVHSLRKQQGTETGLHITF